MDRHIFAIGDNGFNKDPENQDLYRFLLSQTGKVWPRVCLIPTASGDAQSTIDAFFSMFKKLDCDLTLLSLFRGEKEDLASVVLNQDLIYVSGGNTRNMLVLWKEWGLDVLIRRAYDQGVILAGGSAGSLAWFEGGVTDSIPERFSSMKCLGFLKGSNSPHYNELTRRPFFQNAIATGELPSGMASENGVCLHFVNEAFKEAVSPYAEKFAYRVTRVGSGYEEEAIPARVLTKTQDS
jgi:hypothetical protein